MRILFIGDIYGKPGMEILENHINHLKEEYHPHLIFANGENCANGRGINLKLYKKLMSMGIHALTMGNWVWGNQELFAFIDEANIARPANFLTAPGKPFLTLNFNGTKIILINLLGRVFMNPSVENPFLLAKKIIDENKADHYIIDFHAEATSEKVALGHYLDGQVDAIVGTHTHVPTADERKLPKGTLYISDIGMTGALNGVIGVKKEIVIERFMNGFSTPNETADGVKQLNAVLLDLTNKTIKRIHIES